MLHNPQWENARKEDPRRVLFLEWVKRREDFFGPATTALFRRGRAQVRDGWMEGLIAECRV